MILRIPSDLLLDTHLILLNRNLQLYFNNMEYIHDFNDILHSILKPRNYYLLKTFPELNHIEFHDVEIK